MGARATRSRPGRRWNTVGHRSSGRRLRAAGNRLAVRAWPRETTAGTSSSSSRSRREPSVALAKSPRESRGLRFLSLINRGGARSSHQHPLELLFNVGPLFIENAVVDAVAVAAGPHQRVLAQNALLLGPNSQHGLS